MKKSAKIFMTLLMVMLAAAMVVALVGCNGSDKPSSLQKDAAERIQVDDNHVYLAPTGAPSTYTLHPIVYPLETASQKVYYKIVDSADKKYLTVNEHGVLQARGELKTDEEDNNLDITVRIISAATPSVTLNVTVTIESVEVKKISFPEHTIILENNSPGVQLHPVFTPYHAIIGRNVEYTSRDESIATVDSDGFVRPVSVGKVAIWVATPRQGAFGDQVEAYVNIDVRYPDLSYRMDLTSEPSTLKQIYGRSETISFNLTMLDLECDPSPSVTWYVDNTPIDGVGVKDSLMLRYDPSALPPGEYRIRAELINGTQFRELIYPEPIKVYRPLENITLDLLGTATEYVEGNNINMLVTYAQGVYPPESYIWTIVHTDKNNVVKRDYVNKAPAVQEGHIVKPDLSYQALEVGDYEIYAEAFVKGVTSGVFTNHLKVHVSECPEGIDITDMYVDGVVVANELYPAVKWKPLPYETSYTVTVRNGAGDTVVLTSEKDSNYFIENGVYLPAAFKFDQDFSVKVTSGKFKGETDWLEYTHDTVKSVPSSYFNEIIGGYNGYIADMRELGDLINYLAVYRPTDKSILIEENGQKMYSLNIYIPFTYDDDLKSLYPVSQADYNSIQGRDYTMAQSDTHLLTVAARRAYVESVGMLCGVGKNCVLGGARTLYLWFDSDESPSMAYTDTPSMTDAESYTHYSAAPRGTGARLPIDNLSATEAVRTSNQLYLAVMRGKRPVPEAGSAAERIYNKARSVLLAVNGEKSTDREKVIAIYDWLSSNVVYDHDIAEGLTSQDNPYKYNSFYLEGVFDDGVAVCDGIAKAFSLLCGMEGIPTYRICGTNKSNVGHAWNAALIDGAYYVIDVTWSNYNPDGTDFELISYKNFCLSKSEASLEHVQYGEYSIAEGSGYNYAYSIEVATGYDTLIDSDEELTYIASELLPAALGHKAEVWIEIKLDFDYLIAKGGTTGQSEDSASIKGIIFAGIPDNHGVDILDDYSGTLYIKLQKIA